MVFVKANDALLCRLMDHLARPPPSADTSSALQSDVIQPFIAATLHNLMESIIPSHLQDALWVYLYLRRSFLEQQEAEKDNTTSVGGLAEPDTGANKNGDPFAGVLRSPRRLAFSSAVVATLHSRHVKDAPWAAARGHRKLDELLRTKQGELNAASLPSAPSPSSTTAPPRASPPPGSARAVVELALSAFLSPRRLQALLTPPTLCLLVRDTESLWTLLYLCKQVKLRLLRQSNVLTGREPTAPPLQARPHAKQGSVRGASAHQDVEEALPADECFHDVELLFPLHVLQSVQAATGHTVDALLAACSPANADAVWEVQSQLFFARERDAGAAEDEKRREKAVAKASQNDATDAARPPPPQQVNRIPVLRPLTSPEEVRDAQANTQAQASWATRVHYPTPSVSLIINPAVSSAMPNPARQLKNRRVDVIEQAAMRYYYDKLTNVGGNAETNRTASAGAAATAGLSGDSTDMFTHLQAQLSKTTMTVIDPAQMERHHLTDSGGAGVDAATGGGSGHPHHDVLPAHRRMKSLERMASEKASFAHFMKDSFIGLDIQIMALSGAAIGYYMGMLRGASKETCLVYAIVGLVVMMLVDAVLLMIRLGREDEATRKAKKRIAKQRSKLFAAEAAKGAAAEALRRELAEEEAPMQPPPPIAVDAVEKKNQ